MEEILLEFQADPSKVPLSILAEEEAAKALENGDFSEGKSVPPPNPFAAFGKQTVPGRFFITLTRWCSCTHRQHFGWFDSYGHGIHLAIPI
jgi:hypothetical protein